MSKSTTTKVKRASPWWKWVSTVNNYDKLEHGSMVLNFVALIEKKNKKKLKFNYMIGKEKGDENEVPHLQIAVWSACSKYKWRPLEVLKYEVNGKSPFGNWKRMEFAPQTNWNYCKKDGDFYTNVCFPDRYVGTGALISQSCPLDNKSWVEHRIIKGCVVCPNFKKCNKCKPLFYKYKCSNQEKFKLCDRQYWNKQFYIEREYNDYGKNEKYGKYRGRKIALNRANPDHKSNILWTYPINDNLKRQHYHWHFDCKTDARDDEPEFLKDYKSCFGDMTLKNSENIEGLRNAFDIGIEQDIKEFELKVKEHNEKVKLNDKKSDD